MTLAPPPGRTAAVEGGMAPPTLLSRRLDAKDSFREATDTDFAALGRDEIDFRPIYDSYFMKTAPDDKSWVSGVSGLKIILFDTSIFS